MTPHSRALTTPVLLLAAAGLAAQPCYDFGSTPVAGAWTPSPLPLGCAGAPSWPMWQIYTPPHRAPAPHPGFNPGNAHALPRLLVAYRCTGFLLVPVVPVQVRFSGYVIDQPEYPCSP